jgi:hypothetical protein
MSTASRAFPACSLEVDLAGTSDHFEEGVRVRGEDMSGSAAQLYEEDFVRWTEQQSSALREAAGVGTNLPLD